MSQYIPTPAYYDKMPVDISFVFEDEKPAGKHGFLQVDGDNFRFEDGTLGKFWGVMFNGGANFPEHDYAEKVARRIAMTGCNIVRLHQLDAEWCVPNIYQMTAGRRLKNSRDLCEESLDRLDYLMYCLKKEGIYLSVDMVTYRKFKSGDGVKYAEHLHDAARFFSLYDPVMIQLQKEYMDKFWNHYNPYTKTCNKDEPAIVMCTIMNENNLFYDSGVRKNFERIPYYDNMFRDLFAKWLKENNLEYDAYGCDLFTHDKEMVDFKMYLSEKYYRDMMDYMHNHVGVKIPTVVSNWLHTNGEVKLGELSDYTDMHKYISDWHWGEKEKVSWNVSLSDGESRLGNMGRVKIHGKPVFFTEWDVTWPNAYRATGAPHFAAVACLQNWSGMTIHTYSYANFLDKIDIMGKESSSSTIGGIAYREGYFSVWNDPAKFGLFYHSALMLRRGDVQPAKKVVGAKITPAYSKLNFQAFTSLIERHQVQTLLDDTDTTGVDEIIKDSDVIPRENPARIESDTGELWRDLKRSIGAVDSPRTKIVYGFLGRGGADTHRRDPKMAIHLNGLTVDCYTDFGVVALSSLTDAPLDKTDHILLSAIGRARNSGAQFDGEKMIDFGHAPIMSEVICADIELKTDIPNLRVWGVNSEGYYVGLLETTYEDGVMKFHIGDRLPAQYYLIMAE